MSIVDYLYKGVPIAERAAVQKSVQTMPFSQIGKNIIAEGGFGKGSNLRGFDPNFKGGTNLLNYVKGGITSVFGGNAPGNIGGGTPAQRQLFEKILQSPITKTVGPIARSAFSLPMTFAASGPYAMSKLMAPSVARGDFKADEAFQLGQSELGLGEFFTNQDFNQGYVSGAPVITNTAELSPQMSSPRALGAEDIFRPELQTQESKGILDLLKSGGAKIRDTFLQGVGAQGGLNIGAKLGMMVTKNPAFALPAGLLGAFLGATGIREATPGEKGIQSLYGGQNTIAPGTLFVDPVTGELVETEMGGYNIVSGRGKGLPAAIDKRLATIEKTRQRKGQLSQFLQERKERLEAEKAAAEAAELAAKQQAARKAIADAGSGDPTYGEGQQAGMGFGGGRTDPTDKS